MVSNKRISWKMIAIAWLEFQFVYYDIAIQHISPYTIGTLP